MTDPRFTSPVPPYGGQPQDRLPGDQPTIEGIVLDGGPRGAGSRTAYPAYGMGPGPYGVGAGLPRRPVRQKSLLLAALLAGFFPPIGMVYSTFFGTLVMTLLSIPVLVFSAGHAAPVLWPLCVVWAVSAAHRKNQRRLAWAAMGF